MVIAVTWPLIVLGILCYPCLRMNRYGGNSRGFDQLCVECLSLGGNICGCGVTTPIFCIFIGMLIVGPILAANLRFLQAELEEVDNNLIKDFDKFKQCFDPLTRINSENFVPLVDKV